MAQGMVQGLRDAQNLAWKLERALKDRSPAALLDTYQRERRPHVVATTRVAMELGRVICERDPERAKARDARLLEEQGGGVRSGFRQGMIRGLGAGLVAGDTPDAGTIARQPFVTSSRSVTMQRLDDVTGRIVRVVAVGSPIDEESDALLPALSPLQAALVRLGVRAADEPPIVNVVEDQPVFAPWLESLNQRFAVVRPDHYVYGTAATAEGAIALLGRLRDQLNQSVTVTT